MTTFDITQKHDGIVVLSDFGRKYRKTAVYLHGELFTTSRDGYKDDHPATKLSKHLAAEAGHVWREYTTHIWWHLSNQFDIPETLADYDAATTEAYRTAWAGKYLEYIESSDIPRGPEDEEWLVRRHYVLSGGKEEDFVTWYYTTWLESRKSYNERCRNDMDKYQLLEAICNWHPDDVRGEIDQQHQVLRAHLREYLLGVYRATKPLDPVAERAGKGACVLSTNPL